MEDYILWAITGGIISLVIVLLSYMGFFSRVQWHTEETDELILAYSNFNGPYVEIDRQGRLLREKISELCPGAIDKKQAVHVYYDDPRFTTESAKWAVACEVSEDVLDVLSLNSISYIRIPPGICLTVEFPYRNLFSYGIGARKAFDTMVATALEKGIKIAAPPMEFYTENSPRIRYRLYLDNTDVIQYMGETPFETILP